MPGRPFLDRAKFDGPSLRRMMFGLTRVKFDGPALRAGALGRAKFGRAKFRGACGAGRAKLRGTCGAGRAKAGAAGRGAAARGGGAAGRGGGAGRAAGAAAPPFFGGSALATLAPHIATIETSATVRSNTDITASWANGERYASRRFKCVPLIYRSAHECRLNAALHLCSFGVVCCGKQSHDENFRRSYVRRSMPQNK